MYYQHKTVLLASQHQKEQAIQPPFMDRLSCTLSVHDFDTDQFGTFTGEIPRTLSPYETCVLKAKTAAQQYGYAYAIASEGSFGPHPGMPFVASAHEIMVFIDRTRDWVISEQMITQDTNYAVIDIDRTTELDAFLQQVHFPSHALILQYPKDKKVLAKGIQHRDELLKWLHQGFQYTATLRLATDMRAMMNPTRMRVLAELADRLSLKIATTCPKCDTPGFGFKKTKGQLPCASCGLGSSLYAHEEWGCILCDHVVQYPRKDQRLVADPMYCYGCNP